MGPYARRARRRGRRRGLIVGAAVGSAAARRNNNNQADSEVDEYDPYAELKELAQLRDQGLLSEEEFQAKKQQILGL